jgi:hypothetical protein
MQGFLRKIKSPEIINQRSRIRRRLTLYPIVVSVGYDYGSKRVYIKYVISKK